MRQRLRRWWLPAVLVAISLGVLIVSAAQRSLPGVVLGGVLLLASSLWWQYRLRQHPAAAAERWRRLIVPCLLVLIGVALLLARPLLGRTEGLGFTGFCLLFLGIGQLLIELRSPAWQPLRPGLLVAGACAAAFLAGLIGFSTGFSRWALIAMAAGVLVSPIGLSLVTEGVAYHHAGLAKPARSIVEDAFRNRHVRVITSTPTLAAGVNPAAPAAPAWRRPRSEVSSCWWGPGGWPARRPSTPATR